MTNTHPYFLFDTADLDYVKRTWDKLSKYVGDGAVAGITTNPNALAKIKCDTIGKLSKLIYEGTSLLTEMCEYGSASFHVQFPQSVPKDLSELIRWIRFVRCCGDGYSDVAIKVSPDKDVLDFIENKYYGLENPIINVTGLSDAATAHRCLSYNAVSYVSLIPGRMEEVGIDSIPHLFSITNRHGHDKNPQLITGSMRTLDGLKWAIICGSIPTIGSRVWDLMTDEDYKNFPTLWNVPRPTLQYLQSIPLTDDRNIKLTSDFFTQMDVLGQPMYKELFG
jgi:hypothetical protein